MEINFESATQTDLPAIVRIYNSTIASRMVTADLKEVSVDDRQAWFEEHQNSKRPLWVIKVGSEVAGWISLSDFYGRAAYRITAEISIYIDQKFRGQQLGRKSLQFVENIAPNLGVEVLMGYIFAHNTPSINLFKSEGYQEWGLLPKIAEMDNQRFDLSILGKKL